MKFLVKKISLLAQEVIDQITGAEFPTLYFHPQGEARKCSTFCLNRNIAQRRGCQIRICI